MERNYRLASIFGGLAGIAAVVFLATLALAGPRLGAIFTESFLQTHHAKAPPTGDDQLEDSHGPSGCVGPCGPPPLHSPGGSAAGFMPVFDNPEQGQPRYPTIDGDDAHRPFPEGDPSFFGMNFGGGGGGSNSFKGQSAPPIFTGGGGIPPGFLGNPPKSPGGSSPPGGPNSPPGGGDPPPGGGTTPPGGDPTPIIVPEPTAWALFIFGVGAIGVALRSTRPR